MFRSIARWLLLAIIVSGCTPTSPKIDHEKQALALLFQSLDTSIPTKEASMLASDVRHYTKILNRRFERTTDPKIHNFLVNIGIKEKGLCYQYSDALYAHVTQQVYHHFSFHLVGAHIGEFWREHNALVVTAKGEKMEKGVVIDAWRDSDRLYFSYVKEDRAYHWVERPEREHCQKGR
jgi:hypothetical protein